MWIEDNFGFSAFARRKAPQTLYFFWKAAFIFIILGLGFFILTIPIRPPTIPRKREIIFHRSKPICLGRSRPIVLYLSDPLKRFNHISDKQGPISWLSVFTRFSTPIWSYTDNRRIVWKPLHRFR
jgi:hypothetical protein